MKLEIYCLNQTVLYLTTYYISEKTSFTYGTVHRGDLRGKKTALKETPMLFSY